MLNKVILVGRLTKDPELKQTQTGVTSCRFTVAVDRGYKDKNTGEKQADFINVVAWRQTAEFVNKWFSKGKVIIIDGNLRNNNYTDNNGVKHYSMDVYADNVSFGGDSGQKTASQTATQPTQTVQAPPPDLLDDIEDLGTVLSDGDVPF